MHDDSKDDRKSPAVSGEAARGKKSFDVTDICNLIGSVNGHIEEMGIRLAEQRDDIREMRSDLRQVAATCPLHSQRLDQIEKVLNHKVSNSRPSGQGHPAVQVDVDAIEKRVREAAEDAAECYTEEVTGKMKLDAIAAAQMVAKETTIKTLADERVILEESKDRRAKRLATWLQIISTILALLGGGGILAAVKFMASAREAIDNQDREIKRLHVTQEPRESPRALLPAPKQLPRKLEPE